MSEKLGSLTDEQLVEKLESFRVELLRGQFALSMGRLQNTAGLRTLRVRVARAQTEIRRRELERGASLGTLERAHGGGARAGGGVSSPTGGFLAGVVDRLEGPR